MRLSDEEAILIAEREIGSAMPLWVSNRIETAEGGEIYVGTATMGSGITVRIDDATGKVLDVTNWGVR
jgi:hypothetical protein